ncbi:Homeobox protein [Vigna angularis]|uniref:Homeobox protein n=1 Tax=Phaseolus angularis TaxID=3914 RepID=A0A8T0JVH0_PHAAN|nr:Homeobox protein [Vigna angularis]
MSIKHHKEMMLLVWIGVLYSFLVIVGTILQTHNKGLLPISTCGMFMVGVDSSIYQYEWLVSLSVLFSSGGSRAGGRTTNTGPHQHTGTTNTKNHNSLNNKPTRESKKKQRRSKEERDLFHIQIDQFQEIVVTQCKLTGVNPLSQEMEAYMGPDVRHKIVNWIKDHVYSGAFHKGYLHTFNMYN